MDTHNKIIAAAEAVRWGYAAGLCAMDAPQLERLLALGDMAEDITVCLRQAQELASALRALRAVCAEGAPAADAEVPA